MSLPVFGALLLIVAVALWVYLAGSRKFDDMEADLESFRALRRMHEADRAVPQWSRTELYDHQVRGDFANEMREIANREINPKFIEALSEQGPEWLIAFGNLSEEQQRRAQEDFE